MTRRITVVGDVGWSEVEELKKTLEDTIHVEGHTSVILDLSKCNHVGEDPNIHLGGTVAEFTGELRSKKGRLVVVGNDYLKEWWTQVGFIGTLQIEVVMTMDEAEQLCQGAGGPGT